MIPTKISIHNLRFLKLQHNLIKPPNKPTNIITNRINTTLVSEYMFISDIEYECDVLWGGLWMGGSERLVCVCTD